MCKMWKVLLLGAVSFIHVLTGLDMRQCNRALGMESGRIEDRQISASSTFDDQSTGPKNARLNLESGSGAWCPLHQINETSHEWIQIEFPEDVILTGVETQGRFDKGRGMEFATGYMIEYWRSSLGRWGRYKNIKGEEILEGNHDTRSAVLRILDGAIIAKIIRLIPVSQVTRTVCMRLELHGCSLRTSLASYSAPVGSRFDGLDLRDLSYDGDEFDNGRLANGIGKLFDGAIGEDNFEKHPGAWVGWHKSAIQIHSIVLEFSFTERRNFSAIVLHTSNSRKQGAGLFSTAKILFSTSDDDLYSQRVVTFEQIPDDVFETARWVKIGVNHRLAKKIRVELTFGENAEWLLLSEVKFESKPALKIDLDSEDDSIVSIDPKNVGVIATISVDDHSNLFITICLAFTVILAIILLIVCNLNSRLGKNQNLAHKVLPDVEAGYFNYKKCGTSISGVSSKRYTRTPEGQSFDDEYANPDMDACLLGQVYASPTEIYSLPEEDDYSPIEINAKDLKFVQNVGIGEFGKVDLCRLEDRLVAVKSLRPEAEAMESEFKKEIHLMSQLRHTNIVRVIGTTRTKPILCVTEFMENGDLRQFLAKNTKINEEQLLGMATQIAAGMAYLESRKFIHRDLAARNCFVDTDLTVKIGDFGMAKSLYGSDYYRIDGKFALPIRWMAWESVFEGRFSHKSDAWALAVTLWELYSECREKPFQHLADPHVIQNLQSVIVNGILKEHLCRPTKCPMPIYTEIMLPCWRKEERERPTLSSIHRFLQSLQFSQLIPCPPPPNRSAPVPPL